MVIRGRPGNWNSIGIWVLLSLLLISPSLPASAQAASANPIASTAGACTVAPRSLGAVTEIRRQILPELTSLITFLRDRDRDRLVIDDLQPVTGVEATPEADQWTLVEAARYSGVSVGTEAAPEIAAYVVGKPVQGTWLPTLHDIDILESRLPDFLGGQPRATQRLKVGLANTPGSTAAAWSTPRR